MKNRIKYAFLPLLVAFSTVSFAQQDQRVELGWANFTPCSRTIWRNDGIFGTPSPTVEWAEQRVYAYALVRTPTASGIQNDVQQCAVQGAAAATLTAIVASPAGAMPAFKAQFESCMDSRARNWLSLSLETSEGQCMW